VHGGTEAGMGEVMRRVEEVADVAENEDSAPDESMYGRESLPHRCLLTRAHHKSGHTRRYL